MEEVLERRSAKKSEMSPLLRQILAARGFKTTSELETFLHPRYDQDLHDPFLMKDMDKAVARISRAAKQGEKVVVYGDYDIDGLTATTVMLDTLSVFGLSARPYIPDRFEEGYGLSLTALEQLKQEGTDLVITVDCGVTGKAEVEWANANGLDIIITDHHTVPPELPPAVAVLNPKRPDDDYPFKELAGVGVAFKLAQALQQKTGKPAAGHEKWLLDLVALGTVCDVVPLVGENRVLVRYGLMVLNKTRRAGLAALAATAGAELGMVTSQHLGFAFGPRLNAAGRLEHASRSLDLLLTKDARFALDAAEELNQLNRRRQADQAKIVEDASVRAASDKGRILVLADSTWSHGIVGIAASKLAERFKRPVLLLQIMGDTAKGSARSFGGFDLMPALTEVSDLFIKYGGHKFAAGFTLPTDNIDELRRRLNEFTAEATIESMDNPADAELTDLSTIDWGLLEQLEMLEPFGNGNQAPLFAACGQIVSLRVIGQEGKHLKLSLEDGRGGLDCIGFNHGQRAGSLKVGQEIDITFHVEKNRFNGNVSLQLRIQDIK